MFLASTHLERSQFFASDRGGLSALQIDLSARADKKWSFCMLDNFPGWSYLLRRNPGRISKKKARYST
jgi:hypothetical protein